MPDRPDHCHILHVPYTHLCTARLGSVLRLYHRLPFIYLYDFVFCSFCLLCLLCSCSSQNMNVDRLFRCSCEEEDWSVRTQSANNQTKEDAEAFQGYLKRSAVLCKKRISYYIGDLSVCAVCTLPLPQPKTNRYSPE